LWLFLLYVQQPFYPTRRGQLGGAWRMATKGGILLGIFARREKSMSGNISTSAFGAAFTA
jgi:hypothetical protein